MATGPLRRQALEWAPDTISMTLSTCSATSGAESKTSIRPTNILGTRRFSLRSERFGAMFGAFGRIDQPARSLLTRRFVHAWGLHVPRSEDVEDGLTRRQEGGGR